MKPTKQVREYMDYLDMIHHVEEKYNINVRDYLGKFKASSDAMKETSEKFGDETWCTTAYDKATSEQKEAIDYYRSIDKSNSIKYLDHWHWMLENHFGDELRNDSAHYLGVLYILEDEDTPDWVKEITQKIYDEFKYELDAEGGVEVWISW